MLERAHTMERALIRLRWFAGTVILMVDAVRATATGTPVFVEVLLLVAIAFIYNVALTLYLDRIDSYTPVIGYITSGVHTVLVSLGLVVTGGLHSIFMPVLVLVILGASIRFPSRQSLPLSVGITAVWAAVMWLGGAVGPGEELLFLGWAVFLPIMNLFVRHLASEEESQRSEAHRDYLTGLANQRAFEGRLEEIIREAHQSGRPFALLLLDLVDFKSVNDAHGLMVGDEVLRFVAGCLRSSVRQEKDLVARWGGDEFVVLLPGTDELTAAKVTERIRQELATGIRLENGIRVRPHPRFAMQIYTGQTDVRSIMSWTDDQLVYAKRTRRESARGS